MVYPGNNYAIGFVIKDEDGDEKLESENSDGSHLIYEEKNFLSLSTWNVDQGYTNGKEFGDPNFEIVQDPTHRQEVCLSDGIYTIDLLSRYGVDWGEGGHLAIKSKSRSDHVFVSAIDEPGTKEEPKYVHTKRFKLDSNRSYVNDQVLYKLRESINTLKQRPKKEIFTVDLKLTYHVKIDNGPSQEDTEFFFDFPYIQESENNDVDYRPEDFRQRFKFTLENNKDNQDASFSEQASTKVVQLDINEDFNSDDENKDEYDFYCLFYMSEDTQKYRFKQTISEEKIIKLLKDYLIKTTDYNLSAYNSELVENTQNLSSGMLMPPAFFHVLFEGEDLLVERLGANNQWEELPLPTTLNISSDGTITLNINEKDFAASLGTE